MATPNYEIDYNDEKFGKVESDKAQALTENEQTYGGMINESDKYYQAQIDASKEWGEKQAQIQQDNTDFTIEQIEQQKEQANKDYKKEQSGAYTDWQKQSNAYGVNAEQMASSGLANTGFSESSQVSMYNTYQNRVASARESYNQAVLNYNNNIKEAQLQNNSKLAEIAYQSLQQQLELSLQGFQYKNSLIIEQANKKQEIDDRYYNRYQNVLAQMNQENALAEEVRQYNESIALQREQLEEEQRQFQINYDRRVVEFDREMTRLEASDLADKEYKKSLIEQQKAELEASKIQHQKEMDYKYAQLKEEQRKFDKTYNATYGAENLVGGDTSTKKYSVNTEYYQGNLNADAGIYGTFSNGYQPKGITNYGKVTKTGDSVRFVAKKLDGTQEVVTQNIWKTPDGTKWYWDGSKNKYIRMATGEIKENNNDKNDWTRFLKIGDWAT